MTYRCWVEDCTNWGSYIRPLLGKYVRVCLEHTCELALEEMERSE